ncbi:MAG: metallophosphoesterase family protein [Deltaproteobacteria bacterium]|nr:metallophosphoesterase family protein [Deltaproteobacteria bacterium]
MARIGLISDTHGHWEGRAARVFAGVEHIIHAGDIGALKVIERLERIAPVTAVKGNTDRDECSRFPEFTLVEIGGIRLFVTHILGKSSGMRVDVTDAIHCSKPDVVVYGHTHRYVAERIGGSLFVNPGSAGPPQLNFPSTVANMTVERARVTVDFHDLRRKETTAMDWKVFDLNGSAEKP